MIYVRCMIFLMLFITLFHFSEKRIMLSTIDQTIITKQEENIPLAISVEKKSFTFMMKHPQPDIKIVDLNLKNISKLPYLRKDSK